MNAITLDSTHDDKISLNEVVLPPLKPDEVRIAIHAAALNHRDEWCRQGKYPNIKDGVVLGSDGAGVVEEVGAEVDKSWLGQEVLVNPALEWGEEQKAQSKNFRILGMPDHGTIAEYLHIPVDNIYNKPNHLNIYQAAALPLAGLTAYRALFYHAKVSKGAKVLVTGFGGGVAQFAAQFAIAAQADTYVSSGDPSKLYKAKEIGAKAGFDYKDPNWTREALALSGGFDIIIDSAMGETLDNLLHVAKPGGKIVFFGATLGNPSGLNVRKVFWSQVTLQGTTMGSDQDFEDMLAFTNHHKITPIIDAEFPIQEAAKAFDRMKAGAQMGKIVIKIR
ncbi:zinc-binding dehydrogenase [Pleomorphovibrio marinus]|uniref:zinc-binding dehydrogenase n=1 Tax=Pleomorphovibrio marinus TaxID=2164132 RepID=UPI000E0BF401|nr:zinc-binding dehydrogenase [Pleomorphovibrio marinus]